MKLRALIAEATKGKVEVDYTKCGTGRTRYIRLHKQDGQIARICTYPPTSGTSEANANLFAYLFNHADAIADLCEAAQGVVNTISSDCECDECKALRKALAAMGEI